MKKSDTCEFKIKTEPSAEKGRVVFPILMAISFGHFLNDLIQSVIPSVYPIFKEEYGFSFLQIGIITLVVQMTSSILQPCGRVVYGQAPASLFIVGRYAFHACRNPVVGVCRQFRSHIVFSGDCRTWLGHLPSRIFKDSAAVSRGQEGAWAVGIPGGGQRRECGRSAFGCYNHNPVRTEVDSMVCHRRSARVFGIVSCRTMV